MKKNILIITIITIVFTSKAQISLEHIYPDSLGLFNVNLEVSGAKYVQYNAKNVVKLYNLNHSIYKEIVLPVTGNEKISIYHISEHLFNLDDNIELLVSKGYWGFGSENESGFVKIIDETGNVIFQKDSACIVTDRTSSYYGYEKNEDFIYNTNNGTKMILHSFEVNNKGKLVYALPGELSCLPCSSSNEVKYLNKREGRISNFPNPATEYTMIEYEIPNGENEAEIQIYNINGQLINSYKVDRTFDNLRISTSEMNSGTYFYKLQTKKGVSSGKKMIIIK